MRHSERARLAFVEGHAKRHKWRRVALVGLSDMALARQFLVNFPLCSVLVVPVWQDEADMRPGERAAQRNQQRNLRVWSRSYAKRFTSDDGPLVKVAGRAGEFDGVVLWTAVGEGELAEVGAAWSACVKDGGWLLGLDYRSGVTRAVLDQVAPRQWSHFREGIWGVRVRRGTEPDNAVAQVDADAAPEGDAESAVADGERPVLVPHDEAPAAEQVVAQPKRRGRPRKVQPAA